MPKLTPDQKEHLKIAHPTPFDNPAPSTAPPNPSDLSPQSKPKTE